MKGFSQYIALGLCSISILIGGASPSTGTHRSDATRFPNEGNLKYDGTHFAQAYFYWHRVGGWRSGKVLYDQYGMPVTEPRPGLELDIELSVPTFHDKCTSWSNLPLNRYDDCPTAGVSEPDPSRKSFGLGTFDAKKIQNYTWYRGEWYFTGHSTTALDTFARLNWQEVERNLCGETYGPDSIWCVGGVPGEGNASNLLQDYWKYGTSAYKRYYW